MSYSPKVTSRWIGALALVLSAVVPVSMAAPAAAAPSRSHVNLYESHVVTQINKERAKRGIKKLIPRSCPNKYAERWASKIRTSSLRHQNLMPVLRGCDGTRAGENLVRGSVNSSKAVKLWMKSPGHRRNMLSKSFTQIGVATVWSHGQYTTVAVFMHG